MDRQITMEDIKRDSMNNAQATENMYHDMKANQEDILRSSREVETYNIEQVKEIAARATQSSVMTNDRLSFLIQMNKLFTYIQEHKLS